MFDLGLEGTELAEADGICPWCDRGEHRAHDVGTRARGARLATLPLVLSAACSGRRAIPFQTLNFDTGTEQPAHSDTIHFHCVPRHFMCGVWVALERIDEGCGPLVVYPGSHRLPDYDMLDLGLPSETSHYQRYEELVRVLAETGTRARGDGRAGQAIVWPRTSSTAARLTRAGTRKSQVTTTSRTAPITSRWARTPSSGNPACAK